MSLCLPVPLLVNESRCPRVPWATDSLQPDARRSISPLGVALAAALLVACALLPHWFNRLRLRYMLRIGLTVFISTSLIDLLCRHACHIFWGECSTSYCASTAPHRHVVWYASGVIIVVMIFVRYHWSLPLNITKGQVEVGFSHLEAQAANRRAKVKRVARQRLEGGDPGQVPPVFPNGWIPIVESEEVTQGKAISVTALGERFCVFRGVRGKAYVLDAYCPHLGADLSAGGRVTGECIECPFHGWQFRGEDGVCQKIPYSNKVPDVAKAKTWSSCEMNAFIFVWYHAEGEKPTWDMPIIPEVQSGKWKFRGRTAHDVHCHIQEIPENGADVAHLHQVHSRSIFLGSRWMDGTSFLNFLQHDWQPQWQPDDQRMHVGRIQLSQRMRIWGFEVPFSSLKMEIEQIGPATVHLHLQTAFGRGVLLQHIVPEGPLSQRIVHMLYTEACFKQFPANILVQAEATMLERDISVWNNKKFLRKPTLVKEDKLIGRYRRWYSQFYSEHSPNLQSLRERSLEW